MNKPIADIHHTWVESRIDYYVSKCSCGWEGPERRTKKAAEDDTSDHVVASVG